MPAQGWYDDPGRAGSPTILGRHAVDSVPASNVDGLPEGMPQDSDSVVVSVAAPTSPATGKRPP